MPLITYGSVLLRQGGSLASNVNCCCDSFPACEFCTTSSDSFPYTKVVVTITEDPTSLSPFRCDDDTSFAGVYEFFTTCSAAALSLYNAGITLTCDDSSLRISISWNIFTAPPAIAVGPANNFATTGHFDISASVVGGEGIFTLEKDLRCLNVSQFFSFPSTFGLIFDVQIVP